MSLFIEEAKRLLQDAEYGLSGTIIDRKQSETCFNKSQTETNKKFVETSKEKEIIMYAVVDELRNLVEVIKKEDEMMNTPLTPPLVNNKNIRYE